MAHITLTNASLDFPIIGANGKQFKKQALKAVTGGKIDHTGSHVTVRALDNISLHIKSGDRVGIVGHNGAGKSTLLRLIAGIYHPTSGSIAVEGTIAPLISIDVGIDDELNGYENIYRRCMLMGMRKPEIEDILEEITAFCDLGDYLSLPLRTYSAGMRTRLVFSIATSLNPDILVLDEWLSAGDASFVQKAEARMKDVVGKSSILILASHSPDLIHDTCNKLITLKSGKLVSFEAID